MAIFYRTVPGASVFLYTTEPRRTEDINTFWGRFQVWIEEMLARRRENRELQRMFNNASGLTDDDLPEDRVYTWLQRRKNRFASARKRLLDPACTLFYFVVNPERLSILETSKARKPLNK